MDIAEIIFRISFGLIAFILLIKVMRNLLNNLK